MQIHEILQFSYTNNLKNKKKTKKKKQKVIDKKLSEN